MLHSKYHLLPQPVRHCKYCRHRHWRKFLIFPLLNFFGFFPRFLIQLRLCFQLNVVKRTREIIFQKTASENVQIMIQIHLHPSCAAYILSSNHLACITISCVFLSCTRPVLLTSCPPTTWPVLLCLVYSYPAPVLFCILAVLLALGRNYVNIQK